MSALDRFLDGSGSAAYARRDRSAVARQASSDSAAAATKRHREELDHQAALVRTDQIAARGERVVRKTAEIVEAGREAADGDAFAGELILETIQLAHRRMNGQI